MRKAILKLGVAVTAIAVAMPVQAQDAAKEAAAADEGEIIVTAQRREESLQKIPLAVTAMSGEQLAKTGTVNIADVASRTPSFTIAQQGPTSPDLSIRGIGSSDRDAGSDRSVIVFVDEIYTGRAGGIPADLFDLERVEVLRGPQGTLYGKNAVGGVINLITRKPSEEFDLRGEVTAGNRGIGEFKLAAGGGVADGLSARFAFSGKTRSGFYRNLQFNERTDNYRLAASRAQLRYQSGALDLLLSGDYAYDKIDGITTHISPATAALIATGFTPDPDPFTGYNNILGRLSRHNAGASLRMDVDLGAVTVTSLTGYRHLKFAEDRDLAGITIRTSPAGAPLGFESTQLLTEVTKSFSQELRVTSNGSGPFKYVVGLFYQREDTNRVEERKRQLNAARSRPVFDQANLTNSYAIFGQATWEPIEGLSLTAGGRYTIDKKDFGLAVTNPFGLASLSPATQLFDITANDEWKAFTPKFTIDYAFAEDVLAYVTYSKGFKSGGYQGLAANASAARTSFNPEFAQNYEAGIKARFFDRRLTLNLAAYKLDFRDLQFRQRILTIPNDQSSAIVIVANAGKARIRGFELESSVKATNWLTFNLGYSYLDTKITEFNATPGVVDVTGSVLARAPKDTINASVDLSIPVGTMVLGGIAEYQYRNDFRFEPGIDPALLEPGYGLWNARLSLAPESKKWSIEAWMRNIGDHKYRTFAQAVGFATSGVSAATSRTGDPRTFGMTFRFNY